LQCRVGWNERRKDCRKKKFARSVATATVLAVATEKDILKKDLPSVMVRIYGVPALRLRRLSERTSVNSETLAQSMVECGVDKVEKRYRSVK
jgi:hypothetical protein